MDKDDGVTMYKLPIFGGLAAQKYPAEVVTVLGAAGKARRSKWHSRLFCGSPWLPGDSR